MNDYPNSPGHCGVDTSIAAAEALAPHLGNCQRKVFQVIEAAGAEGATGNEVAERLGWIQYAVRPRTSELKMLGRIVNSGRRRANSSGRLAIVWTLPHWAEEVPHAD